MTSEDQRLFEEAVKRHEQKRALLRESTPPTRITETAVARGGEFAKPETAVPPAASQEAADWMEAPTALEDFIPWAVAENENWHESRDITGGEWANGMFHFVRLCRFHPELVTLEAIEAADTVEPLLENCAEDPTDDPWAVFYGDYGPDPSWETFVDLWEKVKRPVSSADPLEDAFEMAEQMPLVLAKDSPRSRQALERFLSIAGYLQGIVGSEKPVALPTKRIGDLMGITRQRVGALRRVAIKQGYLEPVEDHEPPKGGRPGRAAKFRFAMERWPHLKKLFL